ncbi:hypothetical protein ABKV19_025446 [Rosa sericea]
MRDNTVDDQDTGFSNKEATLLKSQKFTPEFAISQTLYFPNIVNVPLFKGCSTEFINQIVIKLHEEFFVPGEVIMEPGNVVDQIYFVCHGVLGGHAPGWQDVQPHDPQVQDATNHVVKSLQQKSNSLFPYELQEIVHAKAEAMDSFEPYGNGTNGENGENGANVENDANGETRADGNGAEHALLPPPPVIPPDVVPLRAQVDITPEPLKKKIVRLPIARRGLGTKGQKIPLLTNRFKSLTI